MKIASELKYVKEVSQEILESLLSFNLNNSELLDIRLCVEEALINAIKYGNKFNKDLKIEVDYSVENDKFQVTIEDEGGGFDYNNLPDPTLEENLQELKGRGIYLIRHLMDEIHFNEKGNRITMVKYLKKEAKR